MAELDRDGITVHYDVHGTDTGRVPLLLTHGYSASSAMWRPNLVALGADRLVVTWDIRGHGDSASPDDQSLYSQEASVADMAAVLDACGVERAAVGGLSLGGYLSLAFHLAHPGRVAALLLFDTGPGYKRDDARAEWNARAVATAEALERRGLDAMSRSPEVAAGRHDPAGLARAARGILAQRDDRVIRSLESVSVPTLVLAGADDHPFLAATDYMAARIPGASKVVLPGAGHAANIDQPRAFDDAVAGFLRTRVDAAGPGAGAEPGDHPGAGGSGAAR